MMTNTKWLRRTLLGGVALSVMATGAQADELAELKAQLEALQGRVQQLEQQPATPQLPDGVSFLTISRGMAEMPSYGTRSRMYDDVVDERGFTIAVTPTADLPAPVAEVTVYGFVKADVKYATEHAITCNDAGVCARIQPFTSWMPYRLGVDESDETIWTAKQSRFGIRGKFDTAVGQIRTLIEGDFYGSPFGTNDAFRLRHAYGEWDITPRWTFLAGQTWFTAALLPIGITTVDFTGPAGITYSRKPQVRLTYHSGPISWAIAAERPTVQRSETFPNLSAYLQFDAAGGHQFIVTGSVSDLSELTGDSNFDIGWVVQGGANINLGDVVTLTGGAAYGKGEVMTYLNQQSFPRVTGGDLTEAYGAMVGLSFNISETTTFNVAGGISENLDIKGNCVDLIPPPVDFCTAAEVERVWTVHANILWQPVKQMRLGWEFMFGRNEFVDNTENDYIQGQFGAWFFF